MEKVSALGTVLLYVSETYVNVRGRNYNENGKKSAGKVKIEKKPARLKYQGTFNVTCIYHL